MSISGPVVHRQLIEAYQQVQSQLKSARASIEQTADQRDRLHEDRNETLLSLAEHYLPELSREAIEKTSFEIREAVEQVLRRKEDHVRRLEETIEILNRERQQQEQQLADTGQRLDQAVQSQEEFSARVEQRLQDDQAFVQLTDRAAVAEAALERAEANLDEIDQDAARKLPAYRESALFQYLHEREYGTDQYVHRGLTRRMDRWLAKFIDYHQAKKSYQFLRKTPEQMRQIIAEDRQALDTVMDELERRRDEVAERLGLPEKLERTRQLQQQRSEQLNSLDEVLADSDRAQVELSDLDDSRGPYYREALTLFRDMLEQRDVGELDRRAQQTPEITDDQIVARLMGVEGDLGQLEADRRRRREEVDRIQAFLEDLGRLMQRFRAAEFDSTRSEFLETLDVFEEVLRAQEDGDIEGLWQIIRSSQRWGPTAAEQITAVATHPLTQVLINAMAHAAGGALASQARRAGYRRGQRDRNWGGGWSGHWGGGRRRR